MIEFKLQNSDDKDAFIELNKLLKATQACESGADANQCIIEGLVKRNGQIELRKRAKIKIGEKIEFENITITVI